MSRLTARLTLAALTASVAMISAGAQAASIQPFTTQALQAAQTKGSPILIHAHADWCSTCRAQDPTVEALSRDPAYSKLVIFKLDYDRQDAEKRALNVRHQSTLIAFAGARETARSTGVTDPGAIRALAATALRQ